MKLKKKFNSIHDLKPNTLQLQSKEWKYNLTYEINKQTLFFCNEYHGFLGEKGGKKKGEKTP